MINFEEILLREISTLPESRHAAVLAFVRSLKSSLSDEEREIEKRFDRAIKSASARAKKYNITQEDIDAEIRAVREEQARHASDTCTTARCV
jgi:hypothetical protein